MNIGLLILRLVIGLLMAGHGAQKIFGWFGGHGLAGTGGFFESLGFRPGPLYASLAGAGEFVGGLLVAAGLLGPAGPALMLSVMIVAALSVQWGHGIFAAGGGVEVPLIYAAVAFALALTGFGAYSVDAWLGLTPVWTNAVEVIALGIGAVGAAGTLALRRPQPAAVSA